MANLIVNILAIASIVIFCLLLVGWAIWGGGGQPFE